MDDTPLELNGAGSVICELRKNHGKTVAEFADSVGFSEDDYGKLERNEEPLTLEILIKISKAVNVMLEELIVSCLKAAHPEIADSKIGQLLEKFVVALKALTPEEPTKSGIS